MRLYSLGRHSRCVSIHVTTPSQSIALSLGCFAPSRNGRCSTRRSRGDISAGTRTHWLRTTRVAWPGTPVSVPCQVNGFVQVVCCRLRRGFGPEHFHRLFAMKLMMRLQCQKFNELFGFASGEVARLDLPAIDCNTKVTEQLNLEG